MRKFLIGVAIVLIIPVAVYAGFSFGLIKAAKKKVDVVNEKVVQRKAAALLTDAQAPTVPTNITAIAVSSCQVNLSWTASTDDVGVTGYKIYRNGGGAPIATPTGTTYNNINLTGGTIYSYTVSACDGAGNCSAQSPTVSTTTPDTQPPTVPTNLTAVAVSSFQINLSWTASTDDAGVTGYKIYRNGGGAPIATPTDTTYNDINLTGGAAYTYTVSACDAAGNCSAQSTTAGDTTLDIQAPTVPTNLTAVAVSSCQINLSWTAATDDIGVTGYKIYRNGGGAPIATPTGTAYNNTGLTVMTAYSYTVSACDGAGNCSAQSPTVSTTTPDTQPPTVPTNLTAVAVSSCQVNLNWTASTDDVGVTGYKIYRNGGGAPIATPTGTTYNNINLTGGTIYTYTISACDGAGNCTAQSPTVSTTTPDTQPPTVPTDLVAVAVSSFQINLSWTASTDDVGVTSYKLYRDGGGTPIATPTGITYNDTGLTTLTDYIYRVSACDAMGNCSAQSIFASTKTLDAQAPTVPTNLTATATSSSQIYLSWTASTDNVGVTYYKIYRNGGGTPIDLAGGTTYNNTGLAALTAYSYTISACDAAGNCSGQSTAASDTTPPAAGGVWLFIPGNISLGTNDFWVMKYEAKNVSGVATATPNNPTPWISITQTDAKATCAALGAGYHLLTLEERQTISRNIEGIDWNWTGGSVGSGGLWRGHSDGSPNNILATADVTGDPDDDPYVGTGHTSPSIERRTHKLSTTKYIWDWSGNVGEWIDLTCSGGTGFGLWQTTGALEWDNAALQDYERARAGPLGNYTSTQNIGKYYGCNVNGNVAWEGGTWISNATAGVYAFAADIGSTIGGSSIGFRCAKNP